MWNFDTVTKIPEPAIVYYITRGETERLHDREVCCPSETRAAITRNAFAVFCFE